jgi:spectinomycin phosphotransferase/16S rRNA (guanine(1405)-N(7))-methyltransferase
VLTVPEDLDEDELAAVLRREWGIRVTALSYRPVGWGGHHWEASGDDGQRWFVTVDDLANKRLLATDSLDPGFTRLRASLASARALKDAGLGFVVAPVPADAGVPTVRLGARFAVAVYPFTDGQSFTWGDWDSPGLRSGVVAMVAAVHTSPAAAWRPALADDFTVPFRDELETACAGAGPADRGPYTRRVSDLAREHSASLLRMLERYDRLVASAREHPGRAVLTHGEPHPGNAMRTGAGDWLLIDWDTALIAPPERDLWDLGEGSALAAYTEATGITPRPELLDLYRLRWDIADIAVDVSRFRRPHTGSAEDEKSWELLASLVNRVCGDW